jgi:hypothetical protein
LLGSLLGSIAVGQLVPVLEQWIIPLGVVSLKNGVVVSSINELIQKGLQGYRLDKKIELNCDEFVMLCEYIINCQQ